MRLRDKISKVNSTFISEISADIMSRAVQILAITDEFYLLNMQLERTVFDIFHIMHRHAHNTLKVLSRLSLNLRFVGLIILTFIF